jgi:AraC family transcriptional regulator
MPQRLSGGQFYGEQIRSSAYSGFTLSETRYQPCSCVPRHCHEHAYFCLIRCGTYREEYGGHQRACGPYTIAFHPPEEVHSEHFGGDEVRSFNVEFSSSWLRDIKKAALTDQPFHADSGPLVALMMRLFDEFETPDISSSLVIEGLTLELLGLCAREKRYEPRMPRWLLRVRDRLTEQCTISLTLADLATEAGVKPGYLASAFRRHFGCTVGTFVRGERISKACRQLTDSASTLADVALETGFADQSHFTRVFKRHVGLTPAAYRKMAARTTVRSKN